MHLFSLLAFTACCAVISGSAENSCHEELARLQEQENTLRRKLHVQEVLLQRMQQNSQPGTADQPRPEPSQDSTFSDCSQIYTAGFKHSGVYRIRPSDSPAPVRAYCDMSDGGGWTVIQRRTNGAVNFNRPWAEYKAGFGDMDAESGEFWLGNDNLHFITTQGNYSLRIHLEDFDLNQGYAEYKNFKVADEQDHYRLSFGVYVGTAGNALAGNYERGVSDWASHQGIKFSTFDKDNDNYWGNCAKEDKGGWWFNKCHSAHLNGFYYRGGHYSGVTDDGVVWYTWRGWWYSLKTTVMKIRPEDFSVDPVDDPNAVLQSHL
ncbi:fibrinogen-like protein 1 [Synchiropus picturatus]